ncbi:hypothetical protein K8R04_01930 [Candidatus Uhrbacteria bacterium]|nr:hypothetical protein [Candidatus Uhrbacteria bacterium]
MSMNIKTYWSWRLLLLALALSAVFSVAIMVWSWLPGNYDPGMWVSESPPWLDNGYLCVDLRTLPHQCLVTEFRLNLFAKIWLNGFFDIITKLLFYPMRNALVVAVTYLLLLGAREVVRTLRHSSK